MKRFFSSRTVVDDLDDESDDVDDEGEPDAVGAVRRPGEGPPRPQHAARLRTAGEAGSDDLETDLGPDAEDDRDDASVDDVSVDDELRADRFSDQMERFRSEAVAKQRSAWAYLGLLALLFGALVLFGYSCSERPGSDVVGIDGSDLEAGGQPSSLVFRVDGDAITLSGSVPDEAARDQLLASAQDTYGPENVTDELVVDDTSTLDGGTIRVVGSADFGDERPQQIQDLVVGQFGLDTRGFEVGSVETVVEPVRAEAFLSGDRVTLSGALPDEQSVVDLVAVAGEIWSPDNVEASGLSVGETTWTDGTIRLTGSTVDTDQRVGTFRELVASRIGALIEVDTTGLTITDDTQLLVEVQTEIDELVAADPISFAPNSPVIDAASDQTLVAVAEALARVPRVAVEVVGHTDNVGPAEDNLILSQQRATAVVERMVELGVAADRLTSRGEGEDDPVADNSTAEGKAANRRIKFILLGTSEIVEPSE